MKKIAALLLLLAFSAQTFSRGIVILDFYVNQSYITAKQCENRYRPMLHCNGKCQLVKKLKQQENKDQQNPERKLENKNETFSSGTFFFSGLPATTLQHTDYFLFSDTRTIQRSHSIFNPPKAT
jgi:hypothetical protein